MVAGADVGGREVHSWLWLSQKWGVSRRVAALGTTLSFGYTGDCSPSFDPTRPVRRPHNYDARRWAVWFDEFPRGLGEQYRRSRPSLNLGNTDECCLLDEFALRTMIAYRFRRLSEMAAAAGGVELPSTAQQRT